MKIKDYVLSFQLLLLTVIVSLATRCSVSSLRKLISKDLADKRFMESMYIQDKIECEIGQNLKLESGSVYLNDSIRNEYRFLHDYYFMQGDHTSDSYDSRFGGLLTDDFILGVGQFIWFSKDVKTDKIRWKRIFEKL